MSGPGFNGINGSQRAHIQGVTEDNLPNPLQLPNDVLFNIASKCDFQTGSNLLATNKLWNKRRDEFELFSLPKTVKTVKECLSGITQRVQGALESINDKLQKEESTLPNAQVKALKSKQEALTGLCTELDVLDQKVTFMATSQKPEHLAWLTSCTRRDFAKFLMKIPKAERKDYRPADVSKEASQLWDAAEALIPLFQEEQQVLDLPETIFAKERGLRDMLTGDLFREKTPKNLMDKVVALRTLARKFWEQGQKLDAQALTQTAMQLIPSIAETCGKDTQKYRDFISRLVGKLIPELDEEYIETLAKPYGPTDAHRDQFFAQIAAHWTYLNHLETASAYAERIVISDPLRWQVQGRIEDFKRQDAAIALTNAEKYDEAKAYAEEIDDKEIWKDTIAFIRNKKNHNATVKKARSGQIDAVLIRARTIKDPDLRQKAFDRIDDAAIRQGKNGDAVFWALLEHKENTWMIEDYERLNLQERQQLNNILVCIREQYPKRQGGTTCIVSPQEAEDLFAKLEGASAPIRAHQSKESSSDGYFVSEEAPSGADFVDLVKQISEMHATAIK